MCFNNKIFQFNTILCDKWHTILSDDWLPFDVIPCKVLRFDTILCGAKYFDKEVGWTNCFDIIFDDEDKLVDGNDNYCWREERVRWNKVKDIKASGVIVVAR